jgi:protein O-mannosyl-transferase
MRLGRKRQWLRKWNVTWLAAGVLAIIVLLAWRNSLESGFAFDNKTLLLEDARIQKASPENLALILHHTYWWPNDVSGLYRPLTTLSYLFNYAILGNADRPAGYHWINLLLHMGNVLLVFALSRRLVGGEDLWPAFLMASVWAVHPVLTESVTNIVGRADLLAGMTVLGGLLMYLRSTEATGWRRAVWLAGLAAITAVGVFCKENAVTVVGIVALYELIWWKRERLRGPGVDLGVGCLAMAPALFAMWWVRSGILSAAPPALFPYVDNPIVDAGFWTGRLTAVKVTAKYLGLLVWPARLSPDYSYAQVPLIDGRLGDWMAWAVVAAVALATALLSRRNKVVFFAAGFAFLTFLPTSNLVIPIGTIMAERFLYLPAIGFAICLILALYSLCSSLHAGVRAPILLALIITAAFGARTWVRNADWRDDETLWSAAVQTSPLSFKTYTGLGQALHALHSPPDAVLLENERSVAILDRLPDWQNGAQVYLRTAAQYMEWGFGLQRRDASGSTLTPPESIPKFKRAKVLLLRAAAILKAHHEADREKGLRSGDPQLRSAKEDADGEADAYMMLSRVDEMLGNAADALRDAREAQDVGPMRANVYERIHDELRATGQRDEARAVLMQGMLLTADSRLQQELVAEYSDRPDELKCAVSFAKAAPALDPSCGIVRKLACSVSGEVIRTGLKSGGQDLAARLTKEIEVKYGCDPR